MDALETKVPPPAVAALVALLIWGISRVAPLMDLPAGLRVLLASVIAGLAVVFSIAGVLSFRFARTTLNPTTVGAATALVTSGIFRVTRNPMYLGLLLALIAWAVFLSSAWALLGPLAFLLYMNRLQIQPEERALQSLFGDDYTRYRTQVRRWL